MNVGLASVAHVVSSRPDLEEALTIGDLLRRCAAQAPDTRALVELRDPDTGRQRVWTYRELLAAGESAARQLLEWFEPGDRVVIWVANRPEWSIVQFGAALAGLCLVAINPAMMSRELDYILRQSRARGLIYNRTFRGKDCTAVVEPLRPGLPELETVIVIDDWADLGTKPSEAPLPEVDPRQPAMLQYTSGTTGRPKGALLSHHALVNTTKATEYVHEMAKGSVWLDTVPIYTTSGSVFTTMSAMWNLGTHVLLSHFDPELVFRGIEEEKADWVPLVPTMAIAVLEHPSLSARDLSSLKMVIVGGAPIAPDLVRRIEGTLGCDIMIIFGQTETASTLCTTSRVDTMEHKTQTVGHPMGGMELRITHPETNMPLAYGEIGEICVRGYSTMLGYFEMPEETAKALDADGWLHTGDLGYLNPDGYPQITGRLKDMIIRGGSNVYPRELEDLLQMMPGLVDSAVFGIPDERYGELVVAAVRRRKEGPVVDDAAILAYLGEHLARYKLPSHIWYVEDYPLTASGKIQKFELRNRFLAERA